MNFKIQIVKSDVEFFSYLQGYFTNYLNGFNNTSKCVTIGVSVNLGGSMPDVVCPILSNLTSEDKQRIRLFPVDERLVPAKHEDNNVNGYLKQLNDEFSFIFLSVDENSLEDANFAALKFEESLSKLLPYRTPDNFPIFDILLLGLGPDGHTCSLFPGHKLLQEKQKWVSPIEDSPKPPPRRITITLPVIENAILVIFIVTGPSKAEVVREILDSNNERYPPTIINHLRKNKNRHTIWLLDENAASLLSSQ